MKWTQIHRDGYSGTLASKAGDGVIVRVELYEEATTSISIMFIPDSKMVGEEIVSRAQKPRYV